MRSVHMAMLELSDARALVDAVKQYVNECGYKPVSVSVVDASGGLVLVERMDGVLAYTAVAALRKAETAVALQCDTAEVADQTEWSTHSAIGLLAVLPSPITWKGGVLLVAPNGQIVGAIAASGETADRDHEVCHEARMRQGLANEIMPELEPHLLPVSAG